jgi:hypothetical protein
MAVIQFQQTNHYKIIRFQLKKINPPKGRDIKLRIYNCVAMIAGPPNKKLLSPADRKLFKLNDLK